MKNTGKKYIVIALILTALLFIPFLYKNGNSITGYATDNGNTEGMDVVEPSADCNFTLTKQQKINVNSTILNLENQKILDYTKQQAMEKGIPEPIMLGLITQESTGLNKPVNAWGALGIMQIVPSKHKDKISKECPASDFSKDLECQIRVGASILRDYYVNYNKKGMKSTIEKYCKNTAYQEKYLKYSGWELALRGYNGFGCEGTGADADYVEKITAYASAFGGGCYSSQAIDEEKTQVSGGIIGQYSFRPSFTVKNNYNFDFYNSVYTFAKDSAQRCQGYSGDSGKECLQKYIDEVNTQYQNLRITLNTGECETQQNNYFYEFVSSVEDCAASTDNNCQCKLYRTTFGYKINMKSNEYGTIFSYNELTSESNNQLLEKNQKNEIQNVSSEKSIYQQYYISKTANGLLLTPTNPNMKECTIIKNKYRMCAVTSDKTPKIENGKTVFEPIKIKFAILLKETVFPPPITNLEIRQKEYSDKDIIVTWDKSSADDVAKYEIYYSTNLQDLKQDIKTVRTIPGKIDIPADKYDATVFDDVILPQEPECQTNNNYCDFIYTDKSGKKGKLEKNKLYYLGKATKFMFVIDGNANHLAESEYNIGVTAVDKSDNELDNIIQVMPIKQITPKDLLSPSYINTITKTPTPPIVLTWGIPTKNIDGSDNSKPVHYEIYDTGMRRLKIDLPGSATLLETTNNVQYMLNPTKLEYNIAIVSIDDEGNKYMKQVPVTTFIFSP